MFLIKLRVKGLKLKEALAELYNNCCNFYLYLL